MPTKAIELHEAAAAGYDAAFEWYRERSPEAARRFDAEFARRWEKSHAPRNAGLLGHTKLAGFRSDAFPISLSIENSLPKPFLSWPSPTPVATLVTGKAAFEL